MQTLAETPFQNCDEEQRCPEGSLRTMERLPLNQLFRFIRVHKPRLHHAESKPWKNNKLIN